MQTLNLVVCMLFCFCELVIDAENKPKLNFFQDSMIKSGGYLVTCLYQLEVPPDNNASARAIRVMKVKQAECRPKVSGQSKQDSTVFVSLGW